MRISSRPVGFIRHRSLLDTVWTALVIMLAALAMLPVAQAQVEGTGAANFIASAANIPALPWEERSDWINVKTDVTPAAKGDGIADDTAAIQAALNKMERGALTGATVFLPAGTYRITQTLQPPDTPKGSAHLGFTLIGTGRTTTLVWDGDVGGRMFWTRHGMPHARYTGLSWDGRNKAAVGFDHSVIVEGTAFNDLFFETEIRHQHEAYRNFTEAGIRVGKQLIKATAETLYANCLFENCGAGIALWHDNVLDHTIRNSEFRRCGMGIYSGRGTNFYAQNCHFEQSAAFDIFAAGEVGSSVRRCTSRGSKQFIDQQAYVAPITVQDCHVDSWTNPNGAIVTWGGGPTVVFDSVFTNPPTDYPPLRVNGDLRARRIILSNNRAEGVKSVVDVWEHEFRRANTLEIPAGRLGGAVKSAARSFLRSTVVVPGKVFDAKRDFGAKGDWIADDTDAIQKTIDAARAHGKGAIAYIPTGDYVIARTLKVSGTDYFIGGSGYGSTLGWKGTPGGTLMEVRQAGNITIENLSLSQEGNAFMSENAADLLHIGSGQPSLVTYDRVRAYGIYRSAPLVKGIHFQNLGKQDRVILNEVEGNLRFIDSAQATIFMPVSYEGSITVEGKSPLRDGFLGGCVRLATLSNPGLWLKDNHSIVMSDFYTESGTQFIRLEGDGALPAGRVTLQGAKFEIAPAASHAVQVDNYRGQLLLGPYEYYTGNRQHKFRHQGAAPFGVVLWGSSFYESNPDFQSAGGARLSLVHNSRDDDRVGNHIANVAAVEAMPSLVDALDDLRRLGHVDLQMTSGDAR